MRRVTRNAALVVAAVLALLLALGAVPSLLGTGDPHYLEATAVRDVPDGVQPANASLLFEESYPYTFEATVAAENDTARSSPYRTGRFGLKGAFTHSPFNEMSAYETQYAGAVDGETVYLRRGNVTYRLTVIQP
jgi:hypothetical protein